MTGMFEKSAIRALLRVEGNKARIPSESTDVFQLSVMDNQTYVFGAEAVA